MKYMNLEDWDIREAHRAALEEIERITPMLLSERTALRSWVSKGNDPGNNPWGYLDEDDWPMGYLEAYRRHRGYCFIIHYNIIDG